eukprot:11054501-Alexandrium_andersonii.AAC.1
MSVFVTVSKAALIHVATSMLPFSACVLARARCSVRPLEICEDPHVEDSEQPSHAAWHDDHWD